MFDFLPDEKRRIIIGHRSLGKLFFSGAVDKENFIEDLRAFAPDLRNKKLNPRIRFTVQELRRAIKEIRDYPSQYWSGTLQIAEDAAQNEKFLNRGGPKIKMLEKRITLQRPIGKQSLELEVAIHPYSNGVIVVNYPGITGDIDGYNNKYGQLADFVQEKGIGAVVRMANKFFDQLPYPKVMIDNFKYVIDYCLAYGKQLSGRQNPTLYLMGFSAGASTIAAVAGYYPAVKKILLIAPSGDVDRSTVKSGLGKFRGEVYVTVGANDEIVGSKAGKIFYDLATAAKVRKLVIVPNCDHQFRGERNGRIMSKAPLWAFAGDITFPSPKGGKKLYR